MARTRTATSGTLPRPANKHLPGFSDRLVPVHAEHIGRWDPQHLDVEDGRGVRTQPGVKIFLLDLDTERDVGDVARLGLFCSDLEKFARRFESASNELAAWFEPVLRKSR